MPQVDQATLSRWLAEARDAYHLLQIGRRSVLIRHGLKTVEYQRADAERLRAYIAQLESQLAGGGRPSGIGIVF